MDDVIIIVEIHFIETIDGYNVVKTSNVDKQVQSQKSLVTKSDLSSHDEA